MELQLASGGDYLFSVAFSHFGRVIAGHQQMCRQVLQLLALMAQLCPQHGQSKATSFEYRQRHHFVPDRPSCLRRSRPTRLNLRRSPAASVAHALCRE